MRKCAVKMSMEDVVTRSIVKMPVMDQHKLIKKLMKRYYEQMQILPKDEMYDIIFRFEDMLSRQVRDYLGWNYYVEWTLCLALYCDEIKNK